jgi:hypothetical protein
MSVLKVTLRIIGVVQFVFGVMFILVPGVYASAVGLQVAPRWAYWLFAMMGARFLGFGYGMFVAARSPARHWHWIAAMIPIQAIDWIATLFYLFTGAVTLAQVTTAAFLPILFIVVLVSRFPAGKERIGDMQ